MKIDFENCEKEIKNLGTIIVELRETLAKKEQTYEVEISKLEILIKESEEKMSESQLIVENNSKEVTEKSLAIKEMSEEIEILLKIKLELENSNDNLKNQIELKSSEIEQIKIIMVQIEEKSAGKDEIIQSLECEIDNIRLGSKTFEVLTLRRPFRNLE